MFTEKENMSVTRGRPGLIAGVSHYQKSLDTDFLEIPIAAAVSSLSCYLSGHGLFFTLLVE